MSGIPQVLCVDQGRDILVIKLHVGTKEEAGTLSAYRSNIDGAK